MKSINTEQSRVTKDAADDHGTTVEEMSASGPSTQPGLAIEQATIREHTLEALILPVRIIAAITVVGVLVLAESVFIPLALAVLMSLTLRPIVRVLATVGRVPQPLSAALLTSCIAFAAGSGLYALGEPAKEWLREAPSALRALQRQASAVRGPLEDMRETTAVIAELRGDASDSQQEIVVSTESDVEENVMLKTSEGFTYAASTLVLLFFILGWGERLFRNAIALLPSFSDRRGAMQVGHAIEAAIGRYLLTITSINICLGVAVALLSYYVGLPNPALWGVAAALLNFMPYIGAAITTLVLLAVSLVSQPLEYPLLAAPLAFLAITTFEGYVVTPYAVGRSLTLNPLVIFIFLLICFFLWGGIGALLAVPILVSAKVALEGSGRSATLIARVLS
ncbi:MAG: AI-2E family transporter [Congregibacter sp.]